MSYGALWKGPVDAETRFGLGCSIPHHKAPQCSCSFDVWPQGKPTACEHGSPELPLDPLLDIQGAH